MCFTELKIGKKLLEGKTKQIFELEDESGVVLVQSKDQITAGNAVRKDQMEGKAAIANKTTSSVFKLLQDSGEDTFIGFDRSIQNDCSSYKSHNVIHPEAIFPRGEIFFRFVSV